MPPPTPTARRRPRLTRDRILRTALQLADREGLEAVTMRRLGPALHVEAMSLYKHVAHKEDLLDGLAELVATEFEVPPAGADWRAAIHRSATSVYEALLRHPWAGPLLESRVHLGPARLRYVDAFIGTLVAAGFPMPVVGWAFVAIDSHTYGFVLQELAWPFRSSEARVSAGELAAALPVDAYPSLAGLAMAVVEEPDAFPLRFEFGLDLLLDGLERLRPTG
jgi:AcrR family transcriptional regulator